MVLKYIVNEKYMNRTVLHGQSEVMYLVFTVLYFVKI